MTWGGHWDVMQGWNFGRGPSSRSALVFTESVCRRVWGAHGTGTSPRTPAAALALGLALAALLPDPGRAQQATGFEGLGTLGGGTFSILNGFGHALSPGGTVVVGTSNAGAGARAFRWEGGVMVDLGTLPGDLSSQALGVSADTNVIVGVSAAGGPGQAVRWVNGVIENLGSLGGLYSAARGVSANGAIVVGEADDGFDQKAFRWEGGVMAALPDFGGANNSAHGISADGSVIVGYAQNGGAFAAVRWVGGLIENLGTLGGSNSVAYGVSANGLVIVGESEIAGGATRAFRWQGGVMENLGTLGGNISVAIGVSADGSVVVGQAADGGGQTRAFRWTSANGMESIQALLTAAGIDTTGWTLQNARAVSSNGSVIVGNGTNPGGNSEVWLARFSVQGAGIITAGEVARSFASLGALGHTGNAAIGGFLGTLTQQAIQGGGGGGPGQISVFASGSHDTDPTTSGHLGATVRLGEAMVLGAALGADYVETPMQAGGSGKMRGGSAGVFLAHVPGTGLQWLIGASGLAIEGDVVRGYMMAATQASSRGATKARGAGFTARLGWTFAAFERTSMTPFASYTHSRISFDGYTETSGVFPATFSGFSDEARTGRLGADLRYSIAPGKWVWGTLAWAHRFDPSATARIEGQLLGLFGLAAGGVAFARDWLEAGGGIRLPLGERGAVTASVIASIPEDHATTWMFRLALSQAL